MRERLFQFIDRHEGGFFLSLALCIGLGFAGALAFAVSYGVDSARADAESAETAFRQNCVNAGGSLIPRKDVTWNGGVVYLIDCVRPQAREAESGR